MAILMIVEKLKERLVYEVMFHVNLYSAKLRILATAAY